MSITHQGTPGPENIQGTAGNDVISAGSGNDVVNGQGGNDKIAGGANKDRLIGGEGDDIMSGGGSDDVLRGGDGDDILFGDGQDDRLVGGEGADHLIGGNDDDIIYLGAPNTGGSQDGFADKVYFDANDGVDKVYGFEVGLDKVVLTDGGSWSLSYAGGNTILTYGSTSVTFYNATLTNSDIELGAAPTFSLFT